MTEHMQALLRAFTNSPGVVSGEEFSLVQVDPNRFWLFHREGEAMTLSRSQVDAVLKDYFDENF